MTTKRLFHQDPYMKNCDAKVIALSEHGSKTGVELDQTIFYPESGGQPCDLGTINDIPVLDVVEEGQRIVHMLRKTIQPNESVRCALNWDRRFDHMQQHTGQHMLSQAFHQLIQGKTIGFHLGTDKSTIDLDVSDLLMDDVTKVESLVNSVIYQNREVRTHEVTREKALNMPLRKPPTNQKFIRVLEISNYDWTGCCGTHVRQTGEVGLVKILRADNYKGGSRITFVCGFRAFEDYQQKSQLVSNISLLLTVGDGEITDVLHKWKEERSRFKLKLKSLLKTVIEAEAERLKESAEVIGAYRCFTLLFKDRDPSEVQALVKKIIQSPDAMVFAGIQNDRGFLFFGRGDDVDVDVRPLMKSACGLIAGRGGGSPSMAQGSGEKVSEVMAAVENAKSQFADRVCS